MWVFVEMTLRFRYEDSVSSPHLKIISIIYTIFIYTITSNCILFVIIDAFSVTALISIENKLMEK